MHRSRYYKNQRNRMILAHVRFNLDTLNGTAPSSLNVGFLYAAFAACARFRRRLHGQRADQASYARLSAEAGEQGIAGHPVGARACTRSRLLFSLALLERRADETCTQARPHGRDAKAGANPGGSHPELERLPERSHRRRQPGVGGGHQAVPAQDPRQRRTAARVGAAPRLVQLPRGCGSMSRRAIVFVFRRPCMYRVPLSFAAELFTWVLGVPVTKEVAIMCAHRDPGRSWVAVVEELSMLGESFRLPGVPKSRGRLVPDGATPARNRPLPPRLGCAARQGSRPEGQQARSLRRRPCAGAVRRRRRRGRGRERHQRAADRRGPGRHAGLPPQG
jgi:hypothetical protein